MSTHSPEKRPEKGKKVQRALQRHPLRTGVAGVLGLVVLVAGLVLWGSQLRGAPAAAGGPATTSPAAGGGPSGGPSGGSSGGLGAPAGAVTAPAGSTPPATPTRTAARPTGTPPGPAGWPDGNNTGWQHTGVSLKPYPCTGDVTKITKSGTVIDGRDIRCGLLIDTNDVTISRSRVTADAQLPIRTVDGRTGVKITDVEIVGQPGCIAGIGYMGYTALRVNIHGCGDGVRIEDGSTLQDSWIHDFWDGTKDGKQIDTPHHDGAQSTGGSDIVIRHNRIDNPHDQTSCVMIGNQFDTPSNILIENNYLNGGNYTIYLAPTGTNRIVRNNTFTRNHVYGPDDIGGQYVWTGNRYTDGKPVIP